jgi:hypothetical protein
MQTNYFSASVRGGAVVLPLPGQLAPARQAVRRTASATSGDALRIARLEAAGAQAWETAAWLALAAGSLALLVVSLWI